MALRNIRGKDWQIRDEGASYLHPETRTHRRDFCAAPQHQFRWQCHRDRWRISMSNYFRWRDSVRALHLPSVLGWLGHFWVLIAPALGRATRTEERRVTLF